MARSNVLFTLLGALVVAVGVLGYVVYHDHKRPDGVQINLGPGGVSVEKR